MMPAETADQAVGTAARFEGPALTAAMYLMDATADLANGRPNDALRKLFRAQDSARKAAGQAGAAFRLVNAADYAELIAASKAMLAACDALAGQQDDTPIVATLRAAIEKAEGI